MVAKGSPRLSMIGKGSPKLSRMLTVATSSATKKKTAGSPKVNATQRAYWNPDFEKSLIEILLEHKDSRGDNGWSINIWNKMVKEFYKRNTYVNYSKLQIQEKED